MKHFTPYQTKVIELTLLCCLGDIFCLYEKKIIKQCLKKLSKKESDGIVDYYLSTDNKLSWMIWKDYYIEIDKEIFDLVYSMKWNNVLKDHFLSLKNRVLLYSKILGKQSYMGFKVLWNSKLHRWIIKNNYILSVSKLWWILMVVYFIVVEFLT